MKAFFKGLGIAVLCVVAGTVALIWYFHDEKSFTVALLWFLAPIAVWYVLTEFVTKPIQADIRDLHERLNRMEGYDPPAAPPSPFE